MKLFEYMAKDVFRRHGVPLPVGRVARSAAEARQAAAEIGGPVAIKAQVLAGGRGKAGGIKFADTPEEAEQRAAELLGMTIHDHPVEQLLVEQKLQIDAELYVSITVDAGSGRPLVIASRSGGVDIEDVPERDLVKRQVEVPWGLGAYGARAVAAELDLEPDLAKQFANILVTLYEIFTTYDAELVEINPLVVSRGTLLAADGRLNVDDDAKFRLADLPEVDELTPLERRVREIGLSFVELDGEIAVMANGAGITMATIDVLAHYGGRAMNFLDAGGGAAVEPMAQAIGVLVSTNPKALLVNIFGGITRCDHVAQAILTVKEQMGIPVPLVVRLVGTNEEEGVRMLQEAGIQAYRSMAEAAQRVVALAKGEGA